MGGVRKIGEPAKQAGNRGMGRKKGIPNKTTAALKDMILNALNEAHVDGGTAYLKEQAEKNPTAFLTLVGKIIPLQISGEINHVVSPGEARRALAEFYQGGDFVDVTPALLTADDADQEEAPSRRQTSKGKESKT